MGNELNIKIRAILERATSEANINSQIKQIQAQLSTLNIKMNVDKTALKEVYDANNKIKKSILTTTDQYGRQVEIISKAKKGTEELAVVQTKIKNNNSEEIAQQKQLNSLRKQGQDYVKSTSKQLSRLSSKYSYADQTKLLALQKEMNAGGNFQSLNAIPAKITEYQRRIAQLTQELQLSHRTNLANINEEIAKENQATQQRIANEKLVQTARAKSIQSYYDSLYGIGNTAKSARESASVFSTLMPTDTERLTAMQSRINATTGITATSNITNSARESARAFEELFSRSQLASNAMGDVERQTYRLNPAIEQTNNELRRSSQSIGSVIGKILQWTALTSVVFMPIHAIKNGIGTIYELDTALTNLHKVADELGTTVGFKEFALQANQMAINVGHSTKSAIDSITEFKRLGYSLQESEQLAKQALIYSNIGDVDIDESTKTIISTLKGFNLTANDTLRIMDALNEVGNTTSISSAGLGSALQRSASALYEANNSLEESIALITGANSSVQNPEKVGNGLKTVSLRLRGVADENGEVVAGLDKTISKLTGVNIMLDENNFKSTYQIMKEISEVWNQISDVNQAELLEKMFGKHQANIGASLLNSFDESIKAYNNAMNSFGSSTKEQEAYMDSMQAKVNKFRETVAKQWIDATNTKDFKNLIDSATKFIEVFGTLDSVILSIVAGLALWKGQALLTFQVTEAGLIATRTGLAGVRTEGILATIATNGLGASLKGLLMSNPIGWLMLGLSILIPVIQYATKSFERQKEAVETLSSKYQSLQSEINNIESELDTANTRLSELNSQDSLTLIEEDEKRKLEETNEELERQLRIKQAIAEVEGKELNDKTLELLKTKSEKVVTGTQGVSTGRGAMRKRDIVEDMTQFEAVEYNIKKLKELEETGESLQKEFDGLDRSSENYEQRVKDLTSQIDSNSQAQNKAKKYIGETAQSLSEQTKNLTSTDKETLKYKNQVKELSKAVDEMLNGLPTEKQTDWYDNNIKANKDMVNHFKQDYDIDLENFKNFADLKSQVENLLYSDVNNINDNMIASLAEKYNVDLSKFKTKEEQKIAIAKSAIDSIIKMNWYADQVASKPSGISLGSLINKGLGTAIKVTDWYSSINHNADYQSALDEINKIYGDFSSKKTNSTKPVSEGGNTGSSKSSSSSSSAIEWQDETQAIVDTINQQTKLDAIQNESLERQLKVVEASKDYTKQIELQNQLLSSQQKTVSDLKLANDKIHAQANLVRSKTKYNTESWFNADNTDTTSYLALLNSFTGKTDEASKNAVEKIKTIHDQIKTLKDGWMSNKDAIDSMNSSMQTTVDTINDLKIKALETQKDALQEIIDLTVELIKHEKEEEKQAIQDKIDAYKDYIDLQKESLELREKEASYDESVDEKTNEIAKLQKQADTLGLDKSKEAQAQRADILEQIAEKQKDLNKFQHDDAVEKQQSALDKQLESFQNEKDEEIDEIESYLKKTGQLTRDAMRRIDNDGQSLYQDLINYNAEYGEKLENEIVSAWESATKALEQYGSTLNAITSMNNAINAHNSDSTSGNASSSKSDVISQMQANAQAWHKADSEEQKRLSAQNDSLGASINAYKDYSTGRWYTDYTKKTPLFHNGYESGFVGGNVPVSLKQNELLALLQDDELVFNKQQQERLFDGMNMFKNIVQPMNTNFASSINNNNGMTFEIDSSINIQGNADNNTITQLTRIKDSIVNDTIEKINTSFIQRGLKFGV